MRITAALSAAALAFTLTACSSNEAPEPEAPMSSSMKDMKDMQDGMMDEKGASRSGDFEGLNGKKVSGSVSVDDGTLTLSGFASDEGPDLHLYLANGDEESDVMAGKSLGEVAYDEKSQTFKLSGVDADTYDTVVVHCDKAKAVFGAAALS